MNRAPVVIHQYGRPVKARDVDGQEIFREDHIYVRAYHQWFNVLEYDNHFVYRTEKMGAALLCTCGSPAAAVGYQEYMKYSSFKGNQVIACIHHLNTGHHSDGST